ncbi:MAG: DUF6531 domain-containing protein [Chromatiaceae bacterium]|nr:DUF6531 domain-containing protein [Chromatiaceae bacterium]
MKNRKQGGGKRSFRGFLELAGLLILAALFAPHVDASTSINGTIYSNTTWDLAGSPYVLSGEVSVAQDVVLTIDPDVVVKFDIGARLLVGGTLAADGTASAPIVFTSIADDSHGGDSNGDGDASSPASGDWGYIAFEGGSANSVLNHALVSYGGGGNLHALQLSAPIAITNSTLSSNGTTAGPYVIACGAAVTPTITGNTISNNAEGGIALWSGCNATISGNLIANNGGSGIGIASNNTVPTITANTISGNTLGISNSAGPANIINAEGNFWGSDTGPYDGSNDRATGGWYNPGGEGDAVSDYVDHDPWIGKPPPAETDITLGPTDRPWNTAESAAEPVNTATGNYWHQHTDLEIAGPGIPFAFTRMYNAQDSYSGPLGPGWTHSFNWVLAENTDDDSVAIKYGDSHEAAFDPDGSGGYVSRYAGVYDTLVKYPDNSFTLTQNDGKVLTFDPAGRLVTIADRNGNAQALTYAAGGNLESITDTAGRLITLGYDASDRLVLLTDPLGRAIGYAYDGNGDLVAVTDPRGGVWSYVYDASHRVTSITDPRGHILVANTYDADDRVVSQNNGRGFTTTFAYDTPAPGQTSVTDRLGGVSPVGWARFLCPRGSEADVLRNG